MAVCIGTSWPFSKEAIEISKIYLWKIKKEAMKKDPVKYLVLAVKFQDYVAVNDNLKLFKLFRFNNTRLFIWGCHMYIT